MPFTYDPAYFQALEPLLSRLSERPRLATVQDIVPSRKGREGSIAALYAAWSDSPDVSHAVYYVQAADGHQVPIHAFTKQRTFSDPGPAALHYHGGGMIVGSVELFAKPLARLVSETSVPIFSVDYRLAPEYTGTINVEDCFAGLLWLHQNAQEHHIDPARIAVFGESAGGGLAAGVTLMARDRNIQPPLAKQILVYPMMDDRNMSENKAIEPLAFWKTQDNVVAWTALLGDKAGKADADVSPYSAPARAKSLAGVPPAYIDVGTLDIFRAESITYATRLLAEDVSAELHVYPGVPHAFETIAPHLSVSRRAYENRLRALLSF